MKKTITMSLPILSIIVPVYNLEDYVAPCLDSIYLQGVSEQLFEVVAIDDGSSDNSLGCLRKYASAHTNMQVVGKVNGGVSSARNYALKVCKGYFVTFLDADDELHVNSIQQIIHHIQDNKDAFDVLYCRGFKKTDNHQLFEVHSWHQLFEENRIYASVDLLNKRFINGGSVCGGVFRKSFFEANNLEFAEGVANGEDTIFTYLMYACHPRIMFRNIKLNVINVREGSATHDYTMERVRRFERNMLYLIQQRSIHQCDASMFDAINKAAYHSIMLAIDMYLDIKGEKSYKELYDILHVSEIRPLTIINPPFHQRVKACFLNHNFWLCLKLIEWEKQKNASMKTFRKTSN